MSLTSSLYTEENDGIVKVKTRGKADGKTDAKRHTAAKTVLYSTTHAVRLSWRPRTARAMDDGRTAPRIWTIPPNLRHGRRTPVWTNKLSSWRSASLNWTYSAMPCLNSWFHLLAAKPMNCFAFCKTASRTFCGNRPQQGIDRFKRNTTYKIAQPFIVYILMIKIGMT